MAFFQTKAVLFNWFFITLRIMLLLQELELVQFRNYQQQKWVFNERIVGICGMNGAGKTNLLDAIYYLGFSRSYFYRTDAQNVQHGAVGMRLSGNYILNNEPTNITCIIRENNRKELLVNDEVYKKIASAKKYGKPVDGHAPGLRGEDARKYIEASPNPSEGGANEPTCGCLFSDIAYFI